MAIGITGYGAYIPRYRIKTEEIARVWGKDGTEIAEGIGVVSKAVADSDEDTVTISIEAARNALARAGIDPALVGALFVGSESHPYAVKPSGTIVAEALGLSQSLFLADYEFACKAGTAAMQTCYAFAKAGEIKYGIAIGADTAQGQPGDALEYTAASGGAAFVIGDKPVAEIEGTYSFTTDTTDFWRRDNKKYPSHGHRFTGEPAYFDHVIKCSQALMNKAKIATDDIDHVAFHTPNGKFPMRAGKILGFSEKQMQSNLLVSKIGNTYSAASMLVLSDILDKAKAGERILLTSFGSGAGSDSFLNHNIPHRRCCKHRPP